MFDIKEVITLLCKYLSITIGSTLTPEHLRLAKYDKLNDDVVKALWTTLDRLTHFALKDINEKICLVDFDKCVRTKLRFAYLQYPSLDFYCLPDDTNKCSSRTLLIALGWLIAKYNVLRDIVTLKLLNSPLGTEFSKTNNRKHFDPDDAKLSTVQNQINNLLQKSNKLSNNLKAISELYMTKIKLMTRVHAASMSVSGLPHLTVAEMALIKKIATCKDSSGLNLEKMKEMEKTAFILDIHMQWTKKCHVFYTWMRTVLDESEKTEISMYTPEALTDLAKFIYLLRHLIKKRLKSVTNNYFFDAKVEDCPSRLLRVPKSTTEVNTFLNKITNQYKIVDDNLQKKRADLEIELKSVLSFIPNCVHV